MSEEEIIKICRILCGKKNKKGKREYPLFANLQLQLDYSQDEMAEAIEGLVDLYEKEQEKIKKIEEYIKQCDWHNDDVYIGEDILNILEEGE